MKIVSFFELYLFIFLLIGCTSNDTEKIAVSRSLQPNDIINSVTSYLKYNQENVLLGRDFLAFDSSLISISKHEFFQKLITGEYLPLLLNNVSNDILKYKLHKLPADVNKDIKGAIKSYAQQDYKNFSYIGSKMNDLDVIDLNGRTYNAKTTKGKTIVLKFWFINCIQCVAEIPALNTIVARYKADTNIIFLSIALDDEAALNRFLKNRKFKYAIIPNGQRFADKLQITTYPTHMIIDKEHIIRSVSNDASEITHYLKRYAAKSHQM